VNLHIEYPTATQGSWDLRKNTPDGTRLVWNVELRAIAAISAIFGPIQLVEKSRSKRGRVYTDAKTAPLTAVTEARFGWMLNVLRDFILCADGVVRRFPELDVARLQPRLAVCPHMTAPLAEHSYEGKFHYELRSSDSDR
jgi:hypothetical protein